MSPQQQPLYFASTGLSGFLWLVCYVLIIRRSAKDQACTMPFAPLCINVAWEFTFGFLHPDAPPMNYVNMVWFLFDLVIVGQFLRYGRREFPRSLPAGWFLPWCGIGLATALAGVLAITYEFKDWAGSYTGWGDGVLISISSIALLMRRGSVRGQSLYIALTRFAGSLALIPGESMIKPGSKLLMFFFVTFAVFDLIYMMLFCRQCRAEGINPWKRL